MGLLKNHAFSAILFAIAFGVTATHANAQQGKFTLPFEAHWGNVVLQPGEYTISAKLRISSPQVIDISGHGKTVSTFASIESQEAGTMSSRLRILTIGEQHFIEGFDSGLTGKSFTFVVPKAPRNETAYYDTEKSSLTGNSKPGRRSVMSVALSETLRTF